MLECAGLRLVKRQTTDNEHLHSHRGINHLKGD